MGEWTWDQTVNIEGIATAAAALGAAFAYVVDLIVRRLRDYKQRRRGDRGRMILELTQSRYEDGISEAEIRRFLTSDDPECVALRNRYKVCRHEDTPEFEQDLEKHLVDLIFDRLIEVDEPDHFRLSGSHFIVRDRQARRRDEELQLAEAERRSREHAAAEATAAIKAHMGADLASSLWQQIERPDVPTWDIQNLLRALLQLGEHLDTERLRAVVDAAEDRRRPEILAAIGAFVGNPRY